ncbi:MAG: septal ring lytic transglycosylase RlpA family protein [Candidatus Delongbacteria bacterium]
MHLSTGEPRHWLRLGSILALALLLSCSSVPRFTRPDTPPARLRAPKAQAPAPVRAARPVEAPSSQTEFQAGQIWRTTVSWYGDGLHGQSTASGEAYDLGAVSAAHRELPFGTWLQVRNLANGKKLEVRVNDRGPFKEGRDLDLSREAARRLGFLDKGTAEVEVRVLTLP